MLSQPLDSNKREEGDLPSKATHPSHYISSTVSRPPIQIDTHSLHTEEEEEEDQQMSVIVESAFGLE